MAWTLGLLQACNASDTTASTPAPGVAAAQVLGAATVGTTLDAPVRLQVTGPDGAPRRGVVVAWSASGDGAVSDARSLSDASGYASVRWTLGTAAGVQALSAKVQGMPPVTFTATALPDRATAVRFAMNEAGTRLIGDTLRVDPIAVDRFGNVLAKAPELTIETANGVVGVVDGRLVARARGVAVVRASMDTLVARLPVIVDPLTPVVRRVGPDTLVPGGVVVVEGQNFALAADAVELTVGDVPARVTAVSPTRIEAVLPASVPCRPTGVQEVRVTIASLVGMGEVPLRSAARVALAPGASANLLEQAQARCAELVAPADGSRARYVLAVINTSAAVASVSGFELRGTGVGAMAGEVARPIRSAAARVTGAGGGALPAPLREAMVEAPLHGAHLEEQRVLRARFGSPAPVWNALRQAARDGAGGAASAAAVRATAARQSARAGDTVIVRALYASCARGAEVRARVVYAGTRAVVLEDVAAPRAGTMDADYRAIGDEFDRVQYPLLQASVGDPLAMNAAMGGDGRVTMLFTRYVNDSLPGLAGYVSACNFYPKGTFAASNQDEIFYARVPSATESAAEWRRGMRSTVIHEGKHLASFAERFARGTPFEESWLEESTARIAEELYSRTFAGGGAWRSNIGFESVRCEVTRCDERPLMMWKHFSVLHQYMQGVDTLTPIGAAASGDFTFYASGWSLVRWAIDQYAGPQAGDEGHWLRALVRGGPATGLASLAQLTGRPAGQLLADWALANAVDDLPGFTATRRELSFPSWNVRNVMGGLAGAYPSSFVAEPLLARAMTFGAFALPVSRLRAFSSSYFTFEGPQSGSQLLELRGEGGASTPPSSLRMAIVRTE